MMVECADMTRGTDDVWDLWIGATQCWPLLAWAIIIRTLEEGYFQPPDTVTLAADGYLCHYQTRVWDILGWLRRPNQLSSKWMGSIVGYYSKRATLSHEDISLLDAFQVLSVLLETMCTPHCVLTLQLFQIIDNGLTDIDQLYTAGVTPSCTRSIY